MRCCFKFCLIIQFGDGHDDKALHSLTQPQWVYIREIPRIAPFLSSPITLICTQSFKKSFLPNLWLSAKKSALSRYIAYIVTSPCLKCRYHHIQCQIFLINWMSSLLASSTHYGANTPSGLGGHNQEVRINTDTCGIAFIVNAHVRTRITGVSIAIRLWNNTLVHVIHTNLTVPP